MKAVMTTKGQITIPKKIREQAHISMGSEIEFYLEQDGSILLVPLTRPLSSLKGIAHTPLKKPVSLQEMKLAVRNKAIKKFKK